MFEGTCAKLSIENEPLVFQGLEMKKARKELAGVVTCTAGRLLRDEMVSENKQNGRGPISNYESTITLLCIVAKWLHFSLSPAMAENYLHHATQN